MKKFNASDFGSEKRALEKEGRATRFDSGKRASGLRAYRCRDCGAECPARQKCPFCSEVFDGDDEEE